MVWLNEAMVFINFRQELSGAAMGAQGALPGAARSTQEPRKVVFSCRPNEQFLKINDFAIFPDRREIMCVLHGSATYENRHNTTATKLALMC